jgi:hypothetical protein
MSRRFPPPWTVEDFRVIPYDGWNGHVTGAVYLSPEAKTRNMTEEPALTLTCPKCGAPLIAAADLQTTDMLKCPVHGDIGSPQRTSGSDPSAENGKCFNGSVEIRR